MRISRITIVGTGTPATTASGTRLAPAGTSTITHGGTVHTRRQQLTVGDGTGAFTGISRSGPALISEIAIDRPGVWRASGWMPARSPAQISY
ncbi:MAG TPA: hypothetical protein VK823_20055 [Streptosporangiaceae bacterium]|jgi:hypothetical protein|nr:hypothetical protein [Streptosporangiaceae bacterium]